MSSIETSRFVPKSHLRKTYVMCNNRTLRWMFSWGCLSAAILPARAAEPRRVPEVQEHAVLTQAASEDEFPAIGCDRNGTMWTAWISFDGERDAVIVASRGKEGWSPPQALGRGGRDCWRPAMERDGGGRLWVVWAENDSGNWDLWTARRDGDAWSEPRQLTDDPGNDIAPQMCADVNGALWIAWQAVREENFEILAARLEPDGLADVVNVSRHASSDWEPVLAADRNGVVYVAWDSYRFGSYDILLAELVDGQPGKPLAVAATPDYEAHAALAVDPLNRVWVAWDNGGPGWGQHTPSRERLHSRRSVHIACVHNGRLFTTEEAPTAMFSGQMAKFWELPELRVDGAGRLWMIARHLEDFTPPGRRKVGNQSRPHQPRGIWNPYALCYSGDEWSTAIKLPSSDGRNDMRTPHCLDPRGNLWVAWAEDGRRSTRAEEPINHNVHAAMLKAGEQAALTLDVKRLDRDLHADTETIDTPPRPSRHTVTVADQSYQLLFGDTHRHTDISRCGMNFDGSLMDTYRYAIDAVGLDFLAISDHDQDLLKHRYSRAQQGPLQDYAWWRSQKYCDLFYIEGRFLPIYGYEHGGSYAQRGGHKNVLYLRRGMPCYEEDSPEDLFHVLRDKEVVVIPHQLADGGSATNWGKWNAEMERVAEIFQVRGAYEFFGGPRPAAVKRQGNYLRDALGNGVRIGTIASSDHGLVHGAYAGVYAKEFTRAGVLEGLRSRRTFGSTERIVMDLRSGDHWLGSEITTSEDPRLDVLVQGLQPLKLVEVVRNGRIIYSTKPEDRLCQFKFTDTDLARGSQAYYYVRCQQHDDEWAWSSAFWVDRRGDASE